MILSLWSNILTQKNMLFYYPPGKNRLNVFAIFQQVFEIFFFSCFLQVTPHVYYVDLSQH